MKTTIAFATMTFFVSMACTVNGAADPDKTDKAFKKEDDARTWVVYDAGGHMSVGDKFRVKLKSNQREFKPLFKLRTKWGHKKDDPAIKLSRKTNTYLCGMTEVKTTDHSQEEFGHGEWHLFVIEFPYDDLEIMAIKWSPENFDDVLTGDSLTAECDKTFGQNHGGRAHAEPN